MVHQGDRRATTAAAKAVGATFQQFASIGADLGVFGGQEQLEFLGCTAAFTWGKTGFCVEMFNAKF